jgi:hypothetical protein
MASKIWKFICMIWRPTFFGKVFDNWRFNWLQPSQNAFVYIWAGKECARVGGGVGGAGGFTNRVCRLFSSIVYHFCSSIFFSSSPNVAPTLQSERTTRPGDLRSNARYIIPLSTYNYIVHSKLLYL